MRERANGEYNYWVSLLEIFIEQHTLEACPAWADKRRALMAVVGNDLSLSAVVRKMVETPEGWNIMVSFCDIVMSRKKAAERRKEENPGTPPERQRRGGRKRRIFLHQQA